MPELLQLLVVVPLVAAAMVAILLRRSHRLAVRYVALGASIISLLIAVTLAFQGPQVQQFAWFSLGNYAVYITTTTATLNMMLLLIVAGITPLIFTYSIGYLKVPSEQSRYYTEMCIFAAAMMLFAISANFIALFIAWEMLGITSYLLIGFWQYKPKAQAAGRKAITTIIIGDVAMLVAMLLIWSTYGSAGADAFNFAYIISQPATTNLYIAMVLVAIAAFTKSAQFPFTEWLADAMEGPTPVSAFLHSSTMVKAGVFLIAVLLPIYAELNLLYIFIIFGVVSALLGAMNALAEHHIKRILAYSTIEDLALMFIALGFGSVYGAMLLFIVQAFYKALLFMSAGSIMTANEDEEDLFASFGTSKNRILLITTVIGALSLAGIFPLSGFFGKIAIDSSVSGLPALYTALVYAALLTIDLASSLYIFRWLFVPLRKPPLNKVTELSINYRTLPKSMLIPPAILAAFVVGGGIVYFFMPGIMAGVSMAAPLYLSVSDLSIYAETALVLAGLFLAYRLYAKGALAGFTERHKALYAALFNEAFINRFYLLFTSAVQAVAKAVWYFDHYLDMTIVGLGMGVVEISGGIRRVENGQVNVYVVGFVIGLVALVLIFAL